MERRTVATRPSALGIAVAALLLGIPVAPAGGAVTANTTIPIDGTEFVPCANEGVGEMVHITGVLHSVQHETNTPRGAWNGGETIQQHHLEAVGLSTGTRYRAVSVGNSSITGSTPEDPLTDRSRTFVQNFLLVAPGPNNNLLWHEVIHVTTNENGETTADVLVQTISCR